MSEDELRDRARTLLAAMGCQDYTLQETAPPNVLLTVTGPDGLLVNYSMGAGESLQEALVDLVDELTQEVAGKREQALNHAEALMEQVTKQREFAARLGVLLITHGNYQPRE